MTQSTNPPDTSLTSDPQAVWGTSLVPAACPSCGQAFLVPPSSQPLRCPECLTGSLSQQPAWLRQESPKLIVPFSIQPPALEQWLAPFTQNVWLHTDDFTAPSLASRAAPLLWPMWLVDASIAGTWQAETAYDYQVKSSQEMYSDSGWKTNEKIEHRLRWEPRLGTLDRAYQKVSCPAVQDYAPLSTRSGPYASNQAVPYRPEHLGPGGRPAYIRLPDIAPETAWPVAQSAIQKLAAGECQQACAADEIRDFSLRAAYDQVDWTQMLFPLYVTYYLDDQGQPHRVLINAQSGAVSGPRLASQKKAWQAAGILALIAVIVLLVGLSAFAVTFIIPPAAVLGSILTFLALVVGFLACVAAIWPWYWNRTQNK